MHTTMPQVRELGMFGPIDLHAWVLLLLVAGLESFNLGPYDGVFGGFDLASLLELPHLQCLFVFIL